MRVSRYTRGRESEGLKRIQASVAGTNKGATAATDGLVMRGSSSIASLSPPSITLSDLARC